MQEKILKAYADALGINVRNLSLEKRKPAGFKIFYHDNGMKQLVFKQVANPGGKKFEYCKYPCEQLNEKLIEVFFMAIKQERNLPIFKYLFEKAIVKKVS